jgi:hypothetical protein
LIAIIINDNTSPWPCPCYNNNVPWRKIRISFQLGTNCYIMYSFSFRYIVIMLLTWNPNLSLLIRMVSVILIFFCCVCVCTISNFFNILLFLPSSGHFHYEKIEKRWKFCCIMYRSLLEMKLSLHCLPFFDYNIFILREFNIYTVFFCMLVLVDAKKFFFLVKYFMGFRKKIVYLTNNKPQLTWLMNKVLIKNGKNSFINYIKF